MDTKRRQLLKTSLFGALASFAGNGIAGCDNGARTAPLPPPVAPLPPPSFGPLQAPDANGVRVPSGFRTRIVARSGQPPFVGSGFNWHVSPDGGATFPAPNGGWIYVSNSEIPIVGGASALRFDGAGQVVDAYRILSGTTLNCAGGPTPWGTWLSCEEFDFGNVWECDPLGGFLPARLPALGSFKHEAAAVDPATGIIYLSEDQGDGRFYRFVASAQTQGGLPDLTNGTLQVAEIQGGIEGPVIWHDVPDPDGVVVATRYQVVASTAFDRGEGLWYDAGLVYMTTTGDNRVWAYDITSSTITIIYDAALFANPILRGVDNITVSPRREILVAEDGDDMQLVALMPSGDIEPVLQVIGHDGSEITGPAFDPSGTRMYFSSQRGVAGGASLGVTFEMTGPFL